MKYFIDTEFHEYKKKGIDTIELISIGIVNENGKEYYAVCNEFDVKSAWNNEWLKENVLKPIFNELLEKDELILYHAENVYCWNRRRLKQLINKYGKTNKEIAGEIIKFVNPYAENRKCKWCATDHVFYKSGNETDKYQHITKPDSKLVGEIETNQISVDKKIDFYAYYADYDWVVFCWLFGRMIDLPKGFPMFCMDLMQMMKERNLTEEWRIKVCPAPKKEHDALADARWNMKLYKRIINYEHFS